MSTQPFTVPGLNFMSSEDVPDDYGRWMIHGPQGSGKTTLAATIAECGKTLFVDMNGEKGIRSFKGAPFAGNITVVRPSSVTQLDDLYWRLAKGDHEFACVVLDSITGVQKMTMRFLLGHDESAVREIRKGVAPADMRTWGQALDVMVDTATYWYGLADGDRKKPMHVVMTAQTKIKEGDELTGGAVSLTPDVQKGALSIVLATPDYILYCVDDQTEALTAEGWKTYDQLRVGEEVYTLDHLTGEARWEPLIRVNVFEDIPQHLMLSIEGQGHSSLTTMDHRWPTVFKSTRKRDKVWKRRWVTSETLCSSDHFVTSGCDTSLLQEPLFEDSFVELMAWACTEGHFTSARSLTIGQSPSANPENCLDITEALRNYAGEEEPSLRPLRYSGRFGWKCDRKEMNYWRLNREASVPFLEWMDTREKVVSVDFYRSLTRNQLELFIQTSLKADGWKSSNSKVRDRFAQRSRRRAESFQIACIMAGYRTSISRTGSGMWEVGILTRPLVTPSQNAMEVVTHDGLVWCPTTPSGTWLARRNGTTYWTGNTDVEDNIDYLSDESQSPVTHVVRFGSHPGYRTKARVPYQLRGKIPSVLGRKGPTSLTQLSRVLGIGGVPPAPKAKTPGLAQPPI